MNQPVQDVTKRRKITIMWQPCDDGKGYNSKSGDGHVTTAELGDL